LGDFIGAYIGGFGDQSFQCLLRASRIEKVTDIFAQREIYDAKFAANRAQ
jgi:hypothetical protein